MFWDALEGWQPGFGPMDALEGFGGFRSLREVWKAFGRFSEALKGFGKL